MYWPPVRQHRRHVCIDTAPECEPLRAATVEDAPALREFNSDVGGSLPAKRR